jgi:hypothetical protein
VHGTPPLRANLDDALVFARRVPHPLAFLDRLGKRLFDVDIFAGLACKDGLDGMPVVWRGDDHGIDVLVIQHLSEVLARPRPFLLQFFELGSYLAEDGVIEVAESLDLGSILNSVDRHGPALVSAPDQSQHDLVVGTFGPGIEAGNPCSGRGGCEPGLLHKGSSIFTCHLSSPPNALSGHAHGAFGTIAPACHSIPIWI